MKRCVSLLLVLVFMLMLAGCDTSMAFEFKVETGDRIKVTCDTSGGYKFSSDGTLMLNGESVAGVVFMYSDEYDGYLSDYADLFQSDGEVNYLVTDTGDETDYYIRLSDKTCAIVAVAAGPDEAADIFKRFEFMLM